MIALKELGYFIDRKLTTEIIGGMWDNSGQSIATSAEVTPNGGLVREIPLFQGNLGW